MLKPAILRLLGFMKSKDNLNFVLKNESFLMIVVYWMMLTTLNNDFTDGFKNVEIFCWFMLFYVFVEHQRKLTSLLLRFGSLGKQTWARWDTLCERHPLCHCADSSECEMFRDESSSSSMEWNWKNAALM